MIGQVGGRDLQALWLSVWWAQNQWRCLLGGCRPGRAPRSMMASEPADGTCLQPHISTIMMLTLESVCDENADGSSS
eukprot:710905-Rhodomonas_salina.1